MSAEGQTHDPVVTTVLHDPAADLSHAHHEQPHDQASEVAHAWHHFQENIKFFACFLTVILLTVAAWNINFGSWNLVATLILSALRCALIAFFMATMFKPFSFIFRTFIFSAIFLAGMIFLSLWDSEVRGIGDPIKDRINVPSQPHVP